MGKITGMIVLCIAMVLQPFSAYGATPAPGPAQTDIEAQQRAQTAKPVSQSVDVAALAAKALAEFKGDVGDVTTDPTDNPVTTTLKEQISDFVYLAIKDYAKSKNAWEIKFYKSLDFDGNGKINSKDADYAGKNPQAAIAKIGDFLAKAAFTNDSSFAFVIGKINPETTSTPLINEALKSVFASKIGVSLSKASLKDCQLAFQRLLNQGSTLGTGIFNQAFSDLCKVNMARGVELFKTNFGYDYDNAVEGEKIILATQYMIPKSLTAEQLAKFIQTKSSKGAIGADDAAMLVELCAVNNGGQAAWAKAVDVITRLPSGKWGAMIDKLKMDFGDEMSAPMRNQLFLDLFAQMQNGKDAKTRTAAAALYKACVEKKFLAADKNVDLTKKYSQSQWKSILTKAKSPLTKAAAAAMIKDEKWMRSYFFNTTSKGLVMKKKRTDIELQGAFRAGTASKWFSLLTNSEEKKEFVHRVLNMDTTNFRSYSRIQDEFGDNHVFVCHEYAKQMVMAGQGPSQLKDTGGLTREGYSVPVYSYGIPINYVFMDNTDEDHAINAVFIGPKGGSVKDPKNWVFFEPQRDPNGGIGYEFNKKDTISISIEDHTKIGPEQTGIVKQVVKFRVSSSGKLVPY